MSSTLSVDAWPLTPIVENVLCLYDAIYVDGVSSFDVQSGSSGEVPALCGGLGLQDDRQRAAACLSPQTVQWFDGCCSAIVPARPDVVDDPHSVQDL